MFLTYQYRIKDSTTGKYLADHARAVNQVWNYCCNVQRHAQKWRTRWPRRFDLTKLTAGVTTELGLKAHTISEVCREFAKARDKRRGCPKWRSDKRSLGWVPFTARHMRVVNDSIDYAGHSHSIWNSRPVGGPIKTGSFSQDARGRWYVNLVCEVEAKPLAGAGAVGVDLGLKTFATLSNGETIPNLRHTAKYAVQLATAQRANNKKRVTAIHAKIVNARRDNLHKESTRLVRAYAHIVVGNVNSSGLTKTSMAKSVLDAGWSAFRSQLRYKAIGHGVEYLEADESLTTQTCSDCGVVGGPKGIAGLGMRRWDCSSCGASHDRDVNAARNILRVGLECQSRADEIRKSSEGINAIPPSKIKITSLAEPGSA